MLPWALVDRSPPQARTGKDLLCRLAAKLAQVAGQGFEAKVTLVLCCLHSSVSQQGKYMKFRFPIELRCTK
jgi:hypothetical protein